MGEITIMAVATPKPEHYEDCRQALVELQKPTLAEPGCLQFDILESEDQDGKLYFYERFRDIESFDLHFTYDYTQKVFAAYQQWLAEDISIIRLNKVI